MNHLEFGRELRERLLANKDRTLLRIVIAPHFEQPVEFSGVAILQKAEELACSVALPKERSVVLLLLPHSCELFLLQVGLVLKGHIPAILAWPTNRIDPEKYQRNLVHQLSSLPADRLITLPRLAENLAASLPYRTSGLRINNAAAFERLFPADSITESLERGSFPERNTQPSPEVLFLQFSGGTTGAQKAIVVTASMLSQQLDQLRKVLDFTCEDCVASWLPLYHDMGLIACYWMPLCHGAPSLQLGANDWVINPELLLKYISRYSATFCWLPNFAFSYLAQRSAQMQHDLRLDSMRAWINCSEPVRLKSIRQFAEAFADCGVRTKDLQASYAMAETVFAITQSQLGREQLTVTRSRVHHGSKTYTEVAFDLIDDVYVSSGKPVRDAEVKIVSPEGHPCADEVPGEIHVRTPSLFSGYWGPEGFQTHSLRDGWHNTGDFGFLHKGELFVIGRYKDIAIVGGQNIFPEDVEAIVNTIDGIYAGRVVAFGIEDEEYGTQSLAVVAEAKSELTAEIELQLESAIRKLVMTAIGVAPRYVAVVPQRWIVKSTAGKISRRETRERFLRERTTAV